MPQVPVVSKKKSNSHHFSTSRPIASMAQHIHVGDAAEEAILDNELISAKMSVRGGPYTQDAFPNQPVHETMTLAALIGSNFALNPDMVWKTCEGEEYEFIRGVVWNDDPAGLLFEDLDYTNSKLSFGDMWGKAFLARKEGFPGNFLSMFTPREENITARSHFGDLQFLHGMASSEGERPLVTKAKIMMWLEIMYKLALGGQGIGPDTQLQDVTTRGTSQLKSFFYDKTVPNGKATLRLLLGNNGGKNLTKYMGYNVQSRALGSCFHLIQDAYAYGHIRRTLVNEKDCIDRGIYSMVHAPLNLSTDHFSAHIKMRDGIADHWGDIENFHTYKGQDSDEHTHYDHAGINIENMTNLGDRDQFNGMAGVRDGIEQCIVLANFWKAETPWEGDNNVEKWLSDTVFKLSENVSSANHDI